MLTLKEKLDAIHRPKIRSYSKGTAKTVKDFWDEFVAPHLPQDKRQMDVYREWYYLLSKYCKDEDTVFAIRCFSTPCGGSKNYITLRRGFLTKTEQEYSFFYTDNYFAAYFAKMAMDGFVPTYEEFKRMMISRQFPARFGPFDATYEKVRAAYIINGKDPGFTTNGYKIAHIIDTGMNYKVNGRKIGLAEICENYFPRGDYHQWQWEHDQYGGCYTRRLSCPDDEAREILTAHFLRFTCPFNYVLTPKKSCHICHKTGIGDIAETKVFQVYAQEQMLRLFGKDYQEYLEKLKIYDCATFHNAGDVDINIEYDLMLAGTDDLADFARFVVDDCGMQHSTASAYKSSIRAIMTEMCIESVADLGKCIDKAIDYCTSNKDQAKNAGDKKNKKLYGDHRAALKKYKMFLVRTKTIRP